MLQESILFSPGPSIYGGTDQVQRNILGERVLGLPKEPDPEQGQALQGRPEERVSRRSISVDIGLTLPSFVRGTDRATMLEWCRRIDDGPFSSLAVGERIAYWSHDLVTTLTFAAAVTDRVRLESTVVVLPSHDPVRLAKQAATIDVLSGGRLTLGVGVGGREQDYRAVGAPVHRGASPRLDEQVAIMRRGVGRRGRGRRAAAVGPVPVQPGGPPLWTAAMGPKSLARSARWADGLAGFDLAPDPAGVDRQFRAVEAAWRDAGRTTAPTLTTSTLFALGDGARGPALLVRARVPLDVRRRGREGDGRPHPAPRSRRGPRRRRRARRRRLRRVRRSCPRPPTRPRSTGCSTRSHEPVRGAARLRRGARGDGAPLDGRLHGDPRRLARAGNRRDRDRRRRPAGALALHGGATARSALAPAVAPHRSGGVEPRSPRSSTTSKSSSRSTATAGTAGGRGSSRAAPTATFATRVAARSAAALPGYEIVDDVDAHPEGAARPPSVEPGEPGARRGRAARAPAADPGHRPERRATRTPPRS